MHAASLVNLALPKDREFTSPGTEATPRKEVLDIGTGRLEGNMTDAQTPSQLKKKPKKAKKSKQISDEKEVVETDALRKSFEISDEPPGFSPSSASRPPKKVAAKAKPKRDPDPAEPTAEEVKRHKPKKHHGKKAGGSHRPPPNADF